MYAVYRACWSGKVWKIAAVIPPYGAVQVTTAGTPCLQVEGGSLPLASGLLFARMSAAISALVLGFGLCDVAGAALWCDPPPFSPAQVPSPTRSRPTAASTAIQRGWRYQRGSRGGGPAGGPADGRPGPACRPGPPRSGPAYWRRCEARVPPECRTPDGCVAVGGGA